MTNVKRTRPDVATIGTGEDTAKGCCAALRAGVHFHGSTEQRGTQEQFCFELLFIGGGGR